MYFISRYSKLTEWGLSVSPLIRWISSSAAIGAFFGLWYVSVYGTLQARVLAKQRQLYALKEEQTVYQAASHKADQLEAALKLKKNAWDTKVETAQKQASHEKLFDLFDAFAKQGIAVQGYSPRGTIDRSWYTKTSAQVHFAASFEQLLALFDALTKESVPYRCEQVRLERRDNQIFVAATLSHKTPKATP